MSDHEELRKLSVKVDQLTEALAESNKQHKRRMAEHKMEVKSCQDCLNVIKDDTKGIQEMKDDAEHAMRLIVVVRKGLVWLIAYIVIPIATLVALLYVAIHGDWPKWFDMLHDLVA